jgi:hypothetical protein
VRWGWNINAVIKNGPEVEKVYKEMDPTRVVYSDGSTSYGTSVSNLSCHYGLECTGEDFWDRSKPFHVGGGKWHYGQPIDNLVGERRDFCIVQQTVTAIAKVADIICRPGQTKWHACSRNISCLDN